MPSCLCLDGGGVRGIAQISFLSELLRDVRNTAPTAKLSDLFDVVGGVSIGGIIATAIRDSDELFDDVISILEELTTQTFQRPSILGWFGARKRQIIAKQALVELCRRRFVQKEFHDSSLTSTRLIIPTYNTTTQSVQLFDSHAEPNGTSTIDVLLATSAHPMLVGAHRIKNHLYLDGGVARNNPILLLAAVLPTYNFLSIGTGERVLVADSKDAETWSGYRWMANGLDSFLCDSYTDDFVAKRLLGDRLLRFNTRSTNIKDSTNTDDEHTLFLLNLGKGWYWSNKEKIWSHLHIQDALEGMTN